MATSTTSIRELAVNTIRTLAMDAVQAANSGHPGTPMALAPVAHTLWNDVLRYDPAQPLWPNRDRFVLSCGHASMLIYSLIHLAEIKKVDKVGQVTDEPALSLEDLKNFRQWGSLTPGHPEYGETTGVETTTGPLGQGCGNSVGMAIAQRWMAARYDQEDFDLFDYNVYALCSDGDLMEGVSCEAASLAAHLKLSNLCWIYDDNRITIEGSTRLAFSEDVAKRFEGLGWTVLHVADANDAEAIATALTGFSRNDSSPTLIVVRSHIAYGAPHAQDTSEAHGAPLGAEEIKLTKQAYGWPDDAQFLVPEEVKEHFRHGIGSRGAELQAEWAEKFAEYQEAHPALAAELAHIQQGTLPKGWDEGLPEFPADARGVATRASGGKALNALAGAIPWLLGGSADLAPSTKTLIDGEGAFEAGGYGGRNFHFGIREHAMAAAVNGMALAGLRAFGATFFVFTDYMRPSMRLASIMHLPSIFVLTHDSIGVGEDGPTHQPIEHLAACRAIPGLVVLRPGDANESVEAWKSALRLTRQPSLIVLTRQNLPTQDRTKYAPAADAAKGGYILADAEGGQPDVILIGAGSELSLCVDAYEQLTADGVQARVVSMPSFELFDAQDEAYRQDVLPDGVTARVGAEAGIRQGWDKYLGSSGAFVGMSSFGASAPAERNFQEFGITTEAVVAAARKLLGQ
jgi:transketolase